jgi:hypothetical protein
MPPKKGFPCARTGVVFLLLLKTLKEPQHFGSEKIEGKKLSFSTVVFLCLYNDQLFHFINSI